MDWYLALWSFMLLYYNHFDLPFIATWCPNILHLLIKGFFWKFQQFIGANATFTWIMFIGFIAVINCLLWTVISTIESEILAKLWKGLIIIDTFLKFVSGEAKLLLTPLPSPDLKIEYHRLHLPFPGEHREDGTNADISLMRIRLLHIFCCNGSISDEMLYATLSRYL